MGWEGKGLEVPLRGSSFNTRTGLCCGVGWAPRAGGAGAGRAGAGGRPCSRLSVLSLCVCQAVPVLPVRTSCGPPPHPSSQQGWLVLAGEAGAEWDPASPWATRLVTCEVTLLSVQAVDAEPVLPTLQGRGECVCVSVCLCTRVLFNVYISTIYTPWSWGPYISSIPCLGQQ